MDDRERYERGLSKRRKALGNAYVDRTIAATDAIQRRNSRRSSPATPGARSGRGRISTTARGAFW